MKTLKTSVLILAVAAMLVSLVGCGDNKSSPKAVLDSKLIGVWQNPNNLEKIEFFKDGTGIASWSYGVFKWKTVENRLTFESEGIIQLKNYNVSKQGSQKDPDLGVVTGPILTITQYGDDSNDPYNRTKYKRIE